jgi:hypothetical protein
VTEIQAGLSTLTQTQVTGGAYALNSASFAFDAALDFTATQKAATLARVTLVDTTTTNTDMRGTDNAALAATALSTATWTNGLATNLGTTNSTVATNLDATVSSRLASASYTAPANSTIADLSTRIPAALVGGKMDSIAELDSASRVKLDAIQPDYAPLKTSDYTAPANSDITAIKAKTDNLPSDPADQSLIIAATDAVMTRLGAPAGASVSADVAAVKTDTGNLASRITANLFSGITYLSRWLGVFAGKTADSTTLAEINATTAGAGFSNTTDSLEAIRDRGDAAWITGSGGGSGGTTTIVTLQAVAGISPGVIVGPSEPLVIGDDYLTAMNRSIRINLLDADGDPAEVEFGTYALDDVGISIQLLLARSGKPSTVADLVGTCTFFPAVGDVPPYLIVEFTRTETAKAIPGAYDMQAEAVWNDGKVVTFAPYGQIEFVRNIRRS